MNPMDRYTPLRAPDDKSSAAGGGVEKQEKISELKLGTSLGGVFDFSDNLTRRRNAEYLRTNGLRISHLGVGGGEMLDTIERVKPEEKMKGILPSVAAKVLLRVFTMLQGLEDKGGIIEALKNKYPESGCSYCGHKPCQCAVARPEEKIGAQSSEDQESWSIKQWQAHLKEVYGENNSKLGLRFIIGRVISEIAEATAAEMQMELSSSPQDVERFKKETISELADTFAHTIAVCNELGVDLDQAFVERYGKGCPNCGQTPCQCGPFTFVQERKDERTLSALK